jgi:hypothetical protein
MEGKGDSRQSDSRRQGEVALTEHFNKRLTAYALAAGAAGVGVLALAPPAEADIIVKRENIVINSSHPNETLTIVGSHKLSFGFSSSPIVPRRLIGVGGHNASVAVLGTTPPSLYLAARIGPGSKIGASQAKFFRSGAIMGGFSFSLGLYGPWGGPGYLGFDFANRFGWAKMTFNSNGTSAHLTEFAYNTVPGQAILTGQTSVAEPGTGALALLALGSLGLACWRRKKQQPVTVSDK